MNRPIILAQLGGSTAIESVRVIKLAKPGDGQAQTVFLGSDQKFKIDLSGIASEKITFVHVGERLVILFDNKSTLTIDPFFDSSGAPRNNIAFDVNGREIDGSQFASTFPITTDQSVLPAAGDGAGGAPASGANFRDASVDPFATSNPLDLLGQEEFGTFVINDLIGPAQDGVLPSGGGSVSLLVDDENLPIGTNPGSPVDSATISFTAGTDALTEFAFGDISGLDPSLTWVLSNNGNVLTGSDERGPVIRVTLTEPALIAAGATGTVTVTVELLANFDTHPGLNVDDLFDLGSVTVVATDVGGNQVTGTVVVSVSDDLPSRAGAGATVAGAVLEDGLSSATGDLSDGNRESGETDSDDEVSGLAGSLTALFNSGADAPLTFALVQNATGLPTLFSHGEQVVYFFAGNTLTATTSFGTVFELTVNADGSWSFDLQDRLDHVDDGANDENVALRTSANGSTSVSAIDFSAILAATDADGDTVQGAAPGAFVISVQDDVPVQRQSSEEEGPGSITVFVREDGLSTSTGDAGDQSEGNRSGGETTASDQASSSVFNNLNALFAPGADEQLTFGLLSDTSGLPTLFSNGDTVTYSVAGDVLTATADAGGPGARTVFTLTLNPDGTWSFDLDDQLDHVSGSGDFGLSLVTNGAPISWIDFSSIIVAIDADGDEVALRDGSFAIFVQNDSPVLVSQPSNAGGQVDEDLLNNANSIGNPDASNDGKVVAGNVTLTGSLTALVLAGADEPGFFSLDALNNGFSGLFSNGVAVTYTTSASVSGGPLDTLTASAAGTTVFTFVITDLATGAYTFTLLDQLDHSGTGNDQEVLNVELSGLLNYTDADDDTIELNGNVTIAVENDLPTISSVTTQSIDEEGLSGGNLGDSYASGDLAGNALTATSSLNISWGADDTDNDALNGATGDRTVSFNASQPGLAGLMSNGFAVSVTILADGTLVGYTGVVPISTADAGVVFFATLNDDGSGSYNFTLADNLDHPTANTEDDLNLTFAFTAEDSDGDQATSGTFTVVVDDDAPLATSDTNSVTEGGLLTVAAAGVLINDLPGADSAMIAGVRAANGDTTTAVSGGVGSAITGLYGTLTLDASGAYTYQANPNAITTDVQDVFVYTLVDADGDLSTTTLTINVADVLVADNQTQTVNEAALDTTQDDRVSPAPDDLAASTLTGSDPSSGAETVAGQLSVVGAISYALVGSGTGTHGLLQFNSDGSYVYTLVNPVHGGGNNGANTLSGVEVFTYTATGANGNTVQGTITIDVIDDVPTANADTNSVSEGAVLTVDTAGGVQGNDIFGADPSILLGVRAAGGDTTTPVNGGVDNPITGLYGTLTLTPSGAYTYEANPNAITTDVQDVFVYTLVDTDGDLSTTTLTINVANGLVADNQTQTVNEAALDTTQDDRASPAPDDLAASTLTGSDPSSGAETVAGQLSVVGATSYALVGSGTGTHGLLQFNSDGSYVYTLMDTVHGGGNNGANTLSGVEVFTYTATGANGNTVQGTITIDVIDDVTTANADTNSVTEGAVLTVDTASGVLGNDVFSADGSIMLGVRAAGGDTTTPVSGGIDDPIIGLYGTLTLDPSGAYTYQANPNAVAAPGAQDVFVYTLMDGDGDLSTTTLTINVNDVTLVADNQTQTVNEAALDTTQDDRASPAPDDLAASGFRGSNQGSDAETVAGQLSVAGASSYALVGPGTGTHGQIVLNSDGSYVYTLTEALDSGGNNGANTVFGAEVFTYTATDANGNTVQGTITIDVIDDVTTANADTNSVIEGAVLTVDTASGVQGNDVFSADPSIPLGVRAAGGDTTTPVSGGINDPIVGLYGTLTMGQSGAYTYEANPNAITTDVQDVFVYTLMDGDGDLSTTTLTINVLNTSPPPTVAVNIVDTSLSDTDPSSLVTFQFDQDVTGFDLSDLAAVGGTFSGFNVVDANTYQVTFTANDGFSGTGSVSVGTGYTDITGTVAGTSGSDTVSIDRRNPSVSITMSDTNLQAGQTSLVTFTFSEAVINFSNADVLTQSGVLGPVSSLDGGVTWTGTFTPGVGVSQANVMSLLGAYNDLAGNLGLVGSSPYYTVNTVALSATGETILVNNNPVAIPEWLLLFNDAGASDVTNVGSASFFDSVSHLAGGPGSGVVTFTDGSFLSGSGSFQYRAQNEAGSTSSLVTAQITVDSSGALNGNGSANLLFGEAGNDTLDGQGGNDTYFFRPTGDGNDTITDSNGADRIVIGLRGGSLVGPSPGTGLNMLDTGAAGAGDLVITYNGQAVSVANHFVGSNNVEQLIFNGGGRVGAYTLSPGTYALSDDDDGTSSAGGGNTVLAGSNSSETLAGDFANDLLFGNGSNDVLSGNGGSDLLVGGAGVDTITGGDGLDVIRFDQTTLIGNHDLINNYNGTNGDGNGDILDVSALLDAAFSPGDDVNNFVRIILNDGGAGDDIAGNDTDDFLVQVDLNGSSGGANFQTVAVLEEYNTVGLQNIRVHLEGQEYQFTTPA